jgi:hypothetical protein
MNDNFQSPDEPDHPENEGNGGARRGWEWMGVRGYEKYENFTHKSRNTKAAMVQSNGICSISISNHDNGKIQTQKTRIPSRVDLMSRNCATEECPEAETWNFRVVRTVKGMAHSTARARAIVDLRLREVQGGHSPQESRSENGTLHTRRSMSDRILKRFASLSQLRSKKKKKKKKKLAAEIF